MQMKLEFLIINHWAILFKDGRLATKQEKLVTFDYTILL